MADGPPLRRKGLPEGEVSANRMTRANFGSHCDDDEDGCRRNNPEERRPKVTDDILNFPSNYNINKFFPIGFQECLLISWLCIY
jgi:hypothetical protein